MQEAQLPCCVLRVSRKRLSPRLFWPIAGEGKDIELRHQRNPDVVFDCLRAGSGASFSGICCCKPLAYMADSWELPQALPSTRHRRLWLQLRLCCPRARASSLSCGRHQKPSGLGGPTLLLRQSMRESVFHVLGHKRELLCCERYPCLHHEQLRAVDSCDSPAAMRTCAKSAWQKNSSK